MAAWCLEPTDQTIPFKQTAHNNSSFVMLCQVCAAASVVACLWFFVLLALLTWSLHNISLQLRNFTWTLLRLNEQTVGHGDLQKELPLSPAMSLFNMSDQMPMESVHAHASRRLCCPFILLHVDYYFDLSKVCFSWAGLTFLDVLGCLMWPFCAQGWQIVCTLWWILCACSFEVVSLK